MDMFKYIHKAKLAGYSLAVSYNVGVPNVIALRLTTETGRLTIARLISIDEIESYNGDLVEEWLVIMLKEMDEGVKDEIRRGLKNKITL